ncbi:MAG: glycosyltransferase 87 family protein, partial [Stellaceae bacterium]
AFGWETWAAFLHHLPVTGAMGTIGAVPWGTMPSPYVFALALGAPVPAATGLQAAAALFAAFCVWRAWRRKGAAFEAKAATLLAASLLISPYLFYYDLLWAALAVAWLALLGLKTGFARGEREILFFAWLAPAVMPSVFALVPLQLGFPAVLMLLVAAYRRATDAAGAPRLARPPLAAPPQVADLR